MSTKKSPHSRECAKRRLGLLCDCGAFDPPAPKPPAPSARMTDERLAEIQARADACFRAPWTAGDFVVECSCEAEDCDGEQDVQRVESPHEYPGGQVICDVYGLDCFATPHGRFIAEARSDVPDLVAEVRARAASESTKDQEIQRLRGAVEAVSSALMKGLADLARMGERGSTAQMLKASWARAEGRDDLLTREDVMRVVRDTRHAWNEAAKPVRAAAQEGESHG